jgi:hypothetical protein
MCLTEHFAFSGRYAFKYAKLAGSVLKKQIDALPSAAVSNMSLSNMQLLPTVIICSYYYLPVPSFISILWICICFQNSKYYKGGFDPKMSKREAGLILGIR